MIVPMRHLDLLCLSSEGDATLSALRDFGAVHLDLSGAAGSGVAEARIILEMTEVRGRTEILRRGSHAVWLMFTA